MNKNKLNLFIFIIFLSTLLSNSPSIVAQEAEDIRVRDLKVPVSPVINLLGVSPVDVAEPTAPKAFGFTALESATNSQGDFPNNFAVEFAPYWWFSHPELDFEDYYAKTGFGEAILQNLSFSVGSASAKLLDGDVEVDGSRVGVGIRTSLLTGDKNPGMDSKLQEYLDIAKICKDQLVESNPGKLDILSPKPIEEGVVNLKDCDVQAKKIKLLKEVEKLGLDRVGWQLDIANAYIFDAQDNSADNLDLSRIGAWVTASYRGQKCKTKTQGTCTTFKPSQFSFLGIGRYIRDEFSGEKEDNFDVGARVLWLPEIDSRLQLSAEYLRRFGGEDDDRLVAGARYRFDDTYEVFTSVGKAFDDGFEGNNLITIFGLNIGLGKNTLKAPPTE